MLLRVIVACMLGQAVLSPVPIAKSTVILVTGISGPTPAIGPWKKGCDPKFGVLVTGGALKGWCEDSVYINNQDYRELTCSPFREAPPNQPHTIYTQCFYRPK